MNKTIYYFSFIWHNVLEIHLFFQKGQISLYVILRSNTIPSCVVIYNISFITPFITPPFPSFLPFTSLFCNSGVKIQGLMHASQRTYHWSLSMVLCIISYYLQNCSFFIYIDFCSGSWDEHGSVDISLANWFQVLGYANHPDFLFPQ